MNNPPHHHRMFPDQLLRHAQPYLHASMTAASLDGAYAFMMGRWCYAFMMGRWCLCLHDGSMVLCLHDGAMVHAFVVGRWI